ncbi:hypothetical protein MGLY_27830 [Neomoorella glycerini]|uniref:Uncharacterized protein n=1 Tax=Neomoorella glycerini TaxID=55779 RepID=A0A6I5ZUQ2_9FIRM|nr:hypothetical protein [Moorella glycerini]QGP93375.1 hypothetical protein MGLY_27830 [Moorella glycerini]
MLKKYLDNAVDIIKDEKGSLPELTTVLGLAIVAALVVVALMVLAPQTTRDFWNAATGWIRGQFGF